MCFFSTMHPAYKYKTRVWHDGSRCQKMQWVQAAGLPPPIFVGKFVGAAECAFYADTAAAAPV
jgi:hypothetical protein